MSFCTNCGNKMADDAKFCTACGASRVATEQTDNTSTTVPEQPGTSGSYTQSSAPGNSTGTYYQSEQPAPARQNTSFTPKSPLNSCPTSCATSSPKKKSKAGVVVISIVAALIVIGGLLYILGSGSDTNSSDDNSADASAASSATASAEPQTSDVATVEDFSSLDTTTQDNIIAACEKINLDFGQMTDFYLYTTWNEGDVFSFTYEDSLIDVFLYSDGTVFSIVTDGVQVYLIDYKPYTIADHLGSTMHFDEIYPDTGYAFYLDGQNPVSNLTVKAGDTNNYVIALYDANTGYLVSAFFINKYDTLRMTVPEGDYIIHYAAGSTWNNVSSLFGSGTRYFESSLTYTMSSDEETSFTLDITGSTGISSIEISANNF